MQLAASTTRVFYGWWIVAAVFVAEMFAIGSTTYAFGLFVVPVSDEFGLSRATANTGLILIIVGLGAASPLIGRLLDRFPVRKVLIGGALYTGAGFVILGLAVDLWLMAAALLLMIGPGAAAIGPLAAATVVSRWFTRQRGKALGVTAVATSLGGSILVPVMGFNLELFDWRATLIIQGGLIAVVVSAIAWLLVHDRPADLGLMPDGDAPSGDALNPASEVRWTFAQLLKSRDFWCIGLVVALTVAVSQAVLVSIVPYAMDMGISTQQASFLISVLAISSIFGKLLVGVIADRVDKRWLLLVIIGFVAIQLLALLLKPDYRVLVLVLAVAGFAMGGELPVWAALVADRFGSISYGSVMGTMNLINMACTFAALRYIGEVYDRTGDYDVAFVSFIAVVGAAVVILLLIKRVKV